MCQGRASETQTTCFESNRCEEVGISRGRENREAGAHHSNGESGSERLCVLGDEKRRLVVYSGSRSPLAGLDEELVEEVSVSAALRMARGENSQP